MAESEWRAPGSDLTLLRALQEGHLWVLCEGNGGDRVSGQLWSHFGNPVRQVVEKVPLRLCLYVEQS